MFHNGEIGTHSLFIKEFILKIVRYAPVAYVIANMNFRLSFSKLFGYKYAIHYRCVAIVCIASTVDCIGFPHRSLKYIVFFTFKLIF